MRMNSQSLLTLLLSLQIGWAAAGRQRFRQRPESVEVVEGEDVLLRCEVEEQEGRAQWTKDGFALGFEREVPGYPRFSYLGRASLGQHHLLISGVTTTEDGEYQCQVGPGSSNRPIWAAANVTVLVAPQSVEISGRSKGEEVVVGDGSSLTLDCLVKDARPAPTATWLRDGTPLPPGLVDDTVEKSPLPRRWSVRSRLMLRVTAEDDGRVLSCEAGHPAIRGNAIPMTSVTLSVLHPPGHPSISGYREGEVLVAGQRVALMCRSLGGNPRPNLIWRRRSRPLSRTATSPSTAILKASAASTTTTATATTSRLQLTAAAEDDGAEYECRAESDLLQRPLVASVTLTVYYAPMSVRVSGPGQVLEGDPITLTCVTNESNPPASVRWKVQGGEAQNYCNSRNA
ncbi:nephrin-like [Scylla paramamosain]|uniref:nephrin-like n=1 Tax=Scylla paramamosain TaxID=85552 RepID=UPI003082DE5A